MNSRIEQLLEFIEEDSNDVFSRYALALEYWNLNQLEEAKSSFYKVLDIDKDYLAVYYHLGKTLQASNEIDEALSIFNEGIEVAQKQNKLKTKAELLTAIDELEDL
jgi:tetratricopeptide (TPR) repeat protein